MTLSFTGSITSGSVSGQWWTFNGATGIVTELDQFSFSGKWNNGWIADGAYNLSFASCASCGYSTGFLSVYTTTPEPNSLILFGSSVLGGVVVLRRRLSI